MAYGKGTATGRQTRASAMPSQAKSILQRIAEAIHRTSADLRNYIKAYPDFAEIGERMLREWETGIATSLQPAVGSSGAKRSSAE